MITLSFETSVLLKKLALRQRIATLAAGVRVARPTHCNGLIVKEAIELDRLIDEQINNEDNHR